MVLQPVLQMAQGILVWVVGVLAGQAFLYAGGADLPVPLRRTARLQVIDLAAAK